MGQIRQSGDQRRAQILQAALQSFSTRGFDGTTTRAIADACGISEAIVFRHFHTKEALFHAVVQDYGPRRLFRSEFPGLSSLNLPDALNEVLTDYLDTFWANRAVLRTLLLETWRDRCVAAELNNQFAERNALLCDLLMARALKGQLQPELASAATDTISSAVAGFLFRCMRCEPDDWAAERRRFLDSLISTLVNGLSPR